MLKGMKLKAYPNYEQKHTLFCMFGNHGTNSGVNLNINANGMGNN